MTHVAMSMAFAWPAARVWPYLIAFEQVPLWERGVLEVRRVTPGTPVVGTLITARRTFGMIETTLEGEIVHLEPDRAATMELRGGPLGPTRVRYAVEPRSAATSVVTYSAEVDLRGCLRLLGPLVPLLGRREARGNLRRLQRRMAAGIPPTSNVADADAQASGPADSAPPSATPS